MYNDCHDAWIAEQKDGVYPIYMNNEMDKIVYTMCLGHKTVVQKTDPDSLNKRTYFTRNMKQYVNGFGFTSRELFLGLDAMVYLNKKGNDELSVIATMSNGTKFSTKFKKFQLEEKYHDDQPYVYLLTGAYAGKYPKNYDSSKDRYFIKNIENDNFVFYY